MRIQTEQLFNKTLIFLESVVCYGKLERCFIRQAYFDVLVESINYCRAKKGMELFVYCFTISGQDRVSLKLNSIICG